jgi:general stress protein 26
MTVPATEIDSRYSEPGASATAWETARNVLEAAELFWICTVRGDGRPHVTPLVAVWLDGALHFSTGAEEQKALNMRGNNHVIVMTGCNSWDEGLDVVVEGDAVPVTGDSELKRLAEAWTAKWDGRWQFSVGNGCFRHEGGGEAQVFAVAPKKILAFAKGTFSHTRHRFPPGQ